MIRKIFRFLKRRVPFIRPLVQLTALCLVTLVVLWCVWYYASIAGLKYAIKQHDKKIEQLGWPTSYDELFPAEADSSNAAPIYDELFAYMDEQKIDDQIDDLEDWLRETTDYQWSWGDDLSTLTDEQLAEYEQRLNNIDLAPILTYLEQAAQYRYYKMDAKEVEWPDIVIPPAGDYMDTVSLLSNNARLASLHGDAARTTELILHQHTPTRHMLYPASLIQVLTGIAMEGKSLNNFTRATNEVTFTAEQLQQLQASWEFLYYPDTWERTMIAESTIGVQPAIKGWEQVTTLLATMLTQIYSLEHLIFDADYETPFYQEAIINTALFLATPYLYNQMAQFALTYPETYTRMGNIPLHELDQYEEIAPESYVETVFIPGFKNVAIAYGRNETKRHIAIVVCALMRYELAHGQYPQALEALVPEYLDAIPLDPFTNLPLRYIRHEDGKHFLLYGLGEDQEDDNGEPVDQDGDNWETADIVWQGKGFLPTETDSSEKQSQ